MSGKSYTMREMKGIVDYLKEHRAFGEIKGRKMWIDYANTNLTTRTWQSLKETFLKRILPDITNSYYALTVQEIASFRQGCDLEAKLNNKLDIQTIDSSSNDRQIEEPQPSQPDCSENDDAGEVPSKVPQQVRSSTETVVIDTCYKTAEEIRKHLESPSFKDDDQKSNLSGISTKSIRDYITYSEPLTPMLQEVLDDFATEDEAESDKEPQMTIVEHPEKNNINDDSSPIDSVDNNNKNNTEKTNASDNKSSTKKISPQNKEQENTENETCIVLSDDGTSDRNIKSNKLQESNVNKESECINKSNQTQKRNNSEGVPELTTQNIGVPEVETNSFLKKSQDVLTQAHSNLSTDSLLPNNQEALNINKSIDTSVNAYVSCSKKRSKSLEIGSGIPAKKFCSERNIPPSVPSYTVRNKNVSPNMDVNPRKSTTCNNEKQTGSKECNNSTNSNSACLPDNRLSHKKQSKEQYISKPVEKYKPSQERQEKTIVNVKETGGKSKSRRESDIHKNLPRKNVKEVTNEVVVLESRSDTEDQINVSPKKNRVSLRDLHRLQRDEALANALGLSCAGSGRRKHRRRRSSLRLYQHSIQTSDSSDWTSETESEYISPPRGRKYRQTRKYLKPKSARIQSLEEEGGLFVMYGKKIFPVVKDGKIVKNFVTMSPEKESDDEPFWKLKYVEEKKRSEELERLLKENNRASVSTECKEIAAINPIVEQPSTSAVNPIKEIPENNTIVKIDEPQKIHEQQLVKSNEPQQTIKIHFKNNNGEMQLEGHWTYMTEAGFLKRLGQIFNPHPNPTPTPTPTPIPIIALPIPEEDQATVEIAAVQRITTPISTVSEDLDVVKEKINSVEEEILNEIERRDKADSTQDVSPNDNDNVTKRDVRRTNKSSPIIADESPTKPKRGRKPFNINAAVKTSIVTRQRGTPKKALSESEVNEVPNKETKTKKTPRKSVKGTNEEIELDDKHTPKRGRKPSQLNLKTSPNQKLKRKYISKISSAFSSPDISTNSIESTQGYQDSDVSICLRKKRKLSTTVLNKGKAKRNPISRKKNRLYLVDEFSSDSWQSFSSRKSSVNENSSLNTEIYRTESYQILLPKRKSSFQHMEKIDETKQTLNNNNYLDDFGLSSHAINIPTPSFTNDEDSSQVTLPPSPVLSIVENISISKSALNSSNEPVDNTVYKTSKTKMLNEYMFIDVDMSVPLMEQECDIQRSLQNHSECHYNINVPEASQNITESFLNKVCTVNIRDCTLSDSIHKKITNLALDSAKKTKRKNEKKESENENKMDVSEGKNQPKRKTKQRCSTPHRRQNKKNKDSIEPVIEQEHMEACASKNTCPPPRILVTEAEENPPTNGDNKEKIPDPKNSKRRKVKNIIKVKIVRPKLKSETSYSDNNLQEGKLSLQADSGINITESGVFQGSEGDVDLIHNHSDTCLHAHECIDSGNVELIGDSKKSVLSLNTDTELLNELCDIFCENAQDAVSLFTATDSPQTANASEGIIKSDVNISSVNSLITDDLSNDSPQAPTTRNTSWYLLSEDDASNTNYLDIAPYASSAGCGANLQEIFPITCAIPDLSTVTEENSTKFMLSDANTN